MKYNNTSFVIFLEKKREKHLFIDNYQNNEIKQFKFKRLFIDTYINNEIKQFNGQGTYGACDLLLNDTI